MTPKKFYVYIAILASFALIFSIIIHAQKTGNNSDTNKICDIVNSNCDTVQNSIYADILGVDNSILGVIGFTVLIVLSLMQLDTHKHSRRIIIKMGGIASGAVALAFISIQAFILKSFCVFCIFVDIASIIMCIFSIYYLIKHNKVNE